MRVGGLIVATVLSACLAGPVWAGSGEGAARAFRHVDSRTIKSARLILSEIWPASDIVRDDDGDYYAKRSEGVVADRPEKTCWLKRKQIVAAIAALKRARPRRGDCKGIEADIAIHFRTGAGKEIVAVIGDPNKALGGATLIFFDGRLAVLQRSDRDQIKRVAAQAGCG